MPKIIYCYLNSVGIVVGKFDAKSVRPTLPPHRIGNSDSNKFPKYWMTQQLSCESCCQNLAYLHTPELLLYSPASYKCASDFPHPAIDLTELPFTMSLNLCVSTKTQCELPLLKAWWLLRGENSISEYCSALSVLEILTSRKLTR